MGVVVALWRICVHWLKSKLYDRQVEEHEIPIRWNLTERYSIQVKGKPTWLWTFADDHGTYLEKAGNIFSWPPGQLYILLRFLSLSLSVYRSRLRFSINNLFISWPILMKLGMWKGIGNVSGALWPRYAWVTTLHAWVIFVKNWV